MEAKGPLLAASGRSAALGADFSPNGGRQVLPRFGGHLKIGAIMGWEVSDDEEEAI